MQSNCETVKKVMINEASILLNTVSSSKAPIEGFVSQETSFVSSARLKQETECLGKSSFALLSGFDIDRPGKEGEHEVSISFTTKESCAVERHSTFIVAPTHRNSIQNVTTGALQADTALITNTADGDSITAIAEDNHEVVSAKI